MPDIKDVSLNKTLPPIQPETALVFYDGSFLSEYISRQSIQQVCQTLRADALCKGILVVLKVDSDVTIAVFSVAHSDMCRYEEAVIKNCLKMFLTNDLEACRTTLDLSPFPETLTKAFLWETLSAAIVRVLHDQIDDIDTVICLAACLLTQEPLTELLGVIIEFDDRQVGIVELSVLSHRAPSG